MPSSSIRAERRLTAGTLLCVTALALAALAAAGCGGGSGQRTAQAPAAGAAGESGGNSGGAPAPAGQANPATTWEAGVMQLTSTAFKADGQIPVRHTCDGEDLSPPLAWSGAPAGTSAFALICEDPDAPAGTWDHWVLYAIPADRASLPEAVARDAQLSDGLRQGLNGWQKPGYRGPCPPPGKAHRYFFRLYALAAPLDLAPGATKARLLAAMQGRVLATGSLMGTFKR